VADSSILKSLEAVIADRKTNPPDERSYVVSPDAGGEWRRSVAKIADGSVRSLSIVPNPATASRRNGRPCLPPNLDKSRLEGVTCRSLSSASAVNSSSTGDENSGREGPVAGLVAT